MTRVRALVSVMVSGGRTQGSGRQVGRASELERPPKHCNVGCWSVSLKHSKLTWLVRPRHSKDVEGAKVDTVSNRAERQARPRVA